MRLISKSSVNPKLLVLVVGFLCSVLPNGLLESRACAASLLSIDVDSDDRRADIIFRIDDTVRYQYNYLPANNALPARCYVDLFDTSKKSSVPSTVLVDNPQVSKIRTGHYPTKLRVVVDLKQESECSVNSQTANPSLIKISVLERSPANTIPSPGLTKEAVEVDSSSPRSGGAVLVAQNQPSSPESVATETTLASADQQPSNLLGEEESTLSVWGWVRLFSAFDTYKSKAEDHQMHRASGRLGVDWNKELGLENSLDLHAGIDLERIFYDSDLASDDTDFRLYQTYMQYNGPDWDISFGKQRVRWGKSDQLSPVDSLNPQDLRQFITFDLEDRALPSWMLRGRWYGESIGVETIVQPWFQKSKFDYFDSDWAIYRNLRESVLDDSQAPPELKKYVRNIEVNSDKPGQTFDHFSAAARFNWKTDQADFAVSYHYGWETMPTINSFPVKNIDYSGDPDVDLGKLLGDAVFTDEKVQAEYKRQQTVGFEWETVLDPIGFRGEIAYIDHVAFLSSDLTSQRKPVTHLVSGVDYSSASEWYLNLQGSWYHIYDYDDDILYLEDDTVSLLGEINKTLWRGNLKLGMKYNYTLTDQSSYLRPYALVNYFRNFECEFGAMIFNGDNDTLLGSYDRADQVYGMVKYSF